MPQTRFTKIVILESLKAGYRSGHHLFETLQPLPDGVTSHIPIEHHDVAGDTQLFEHLSNCLFQARLSGDVPIIHIECHGNDDELELSDGSRVTWNELAPILRDINVATRLNLFVGLAACSGNFLSSLLSVVDRAAFWGLLSFTGKVEPDALYLAFSSFYKEVLSTGESPYRVFGSAPVSPRLLQCAVSLLAIGLLTKRPCSSSPTTS